MAVLTQGISRRSMLISGACSLTIPLISGCETKPIMDLLAAVQEWFVPGSSGSENLIAKSGWTNPHSTSKNGYIMADLFLYDGWSSDKMLADLNSYPKQYHEGLIRQKFNQIDELQSPVFTLKPSQSAVFKAYPNKSKPVSNGSNIMALIHRSADGVYTNIG